MNDHTPGPITLKLIARMEGIRSTLGTAGRGVEITQSKPIIVSQKEEVSSDASEDDSLSDEEDINDGHIKIDDIPGAWRIKEIPGNLKIKGPVLEKAVALAVMYLKQLGDELREVDQDRYKLLVPFRLSRIEINMKKRIYDMYHGCPNSVCTICEAKYHIVKTAGWCTTVNMMGTDKFIFGRRWAQNYDSIFTLWSDTHLADPRRVPIRIKRLYINDIWLVHQQMSHNHFHYHIVKRAQAGKFLDYQVSNVDTLAIECLRRTFNSMRAEEDQISNDDPAELYYPIRTFWSECSIVGKSALDARARLFITPSFLNNMETIGDLILTVILEGFKYNEYYEQGIVPSPKQFIDLSITELGATF
jgi:hypothetical protein